MKTSKVGLALLLVCCVWAVFIVAGCTKDEVDTTGTIYGIVNDADNGEPVSGVYIVLNPGGKTANTGSDGRFEFLDMEPGQYTIQISKNGYKTNTKRISVVAGEQTSGDMVLERGESRIKLSTNSLIFAKGETSKTFDIMNRYFRLCIMECCIFRVLDKDCSCKRNYKSRKEQYGGS